jgi:integrase
MPITRHHSGRWLYQFDKVIAGERVRLNKLLPKGTTRAQADEYDQRENARLWQAATGGKSGEPLIDDAVLVYLEDHSPTGKHPLKNHADLEASLFLLHPFYSGRPFSQLGAVVDEYFKGAKPVDPKKNAPLSRATIRNRLAYLRSACRYYWKQQGKKGQNPGDFMNLPTVKNARHVYLTREQALPVFRRMGLSWSRDAARVAFYTGWRISEVLAAVPMESQHGLFLTIPDSKNEDPRIVPVHPKVAHLVRGEWPPAVTKWTASKAVKKALRAVGLGHARLHDLRHSAASEMINNGVDLYTVGKVLGHRSAVSTARYAHLAAKTLQGAVGKIGARKSQPGPEAKAA